MNMGYPLLTGDKKCKKLRDKVEGMLIIRNGGSIPEQSHILQP